MFRRQEEDGAGDPEDGAYDDEEEDDDQTRSGRRKRYGPYVPSYPKVIPNMSTVLLCEDRYVFLSGGIPDVDWTHLTRGNDEFHPNQVRDTDVTRASKSYWTRTKPMSDKYSHGSNLELLQVFLLKVFNENGYYQHCFIPDPAAPTTMVNLIKYPHQLSHDPMYVRQAILEQAKKYDRWDTENESGARKILIESLDTNLRLSYGKMNKYKTPMLMIWMELVRRNNVMTQKQIKNIKDKIESFVIQQFDGHDVTAANEALMSLILPLDNIGQWDPQLLMPYIRSLTGCVTQPAHAFQWSLDLNSIIKIYTSTISTVRLSQRKSGMDIEVALDLLGYGYADTLIKMENLYQDAVSNQIWDATTVVDNGRVPAGFAATVDRSLPPEMAGYVMALMQQMTGSMDTSQMTCYNCQEKGHISPNCPQNKSNSSGGGTQGGANRSGGGFQKQGNHSRSTSWKKVAPKRGEPTLKQVDGKTWYYCVHCKRWTLSHESEGHKGPKPKEGPSAHIASISECDDPSAWHVGAANSFSETLPDFAAIYFWPMILAFSIGVFVNHMEYLGMAMSWILQGGMFLVTQFGLGLIAPATWLVVLFLAVLPTYVFDLEDPPEDLTQYSRKQRRAFQQLLQRQSRRNPYKRASIRDHGFHKSYPRRLREESKFYQRAPTLGEQVKFRLQSVDTLRGGEVTRPCHPCPDDPVRVQGRAYHDSDDMGSRSAPTQMGRKRWRASRHRRCAKHSFNPDDPNAVRQVLLSPARLRQQMPSSGSFSVLVDSGASMSISHCREDFVGELQPPGLVKRLNGLAKGLNIAGVGHVQWSFPDVCGNLRTVKVPAYYVPSCNVRLLSTGSFCQTYPGETVVLCDQKAVFSGVPGDHLRTECLAYLDPTNNITKLTSYRLTDVELNARGGLGANPIDESRRNLIRGRVANAFDSLDPTRPLPLPRPGLTPREGVPDTSPVRPLSYRRVSFPETTPATPRVNSPETLETSPSPMLPSMVTNHSPIFPVAAHSSLRIFLVLSLTWNWATATIDFSNAYVHAKLDKSLWINLPEGSHSNLAGKSCLLLKKSLLDTSFDPRLWFESLCDALMKCGLKQSKVDPCLWYSDSIMLCCYADDCALAASDPKDIDRLILQLEKQGYTITKEGTLASLLGIKCVRNDEEGTFTLSQPGLINMILDTTGMQACNRNWTPAVKQTLGVDTDGEDMTDTWSYRSVVEMLLYLTTNTRTDCAFAVSQMAKFTHAPKQSHANAVKTLVRYLKSTRTMGTIMRPTGTLEMDAYCDSDFAGMYLVDPDLDLSSAKSRMGYIILLGNCPLFWREQRLTNRTRYFHSAWHHFWQSVRYQDHPNKNPEADIEVRKIETSLPNADFFTKALSREVFEANRKRVLGW